MAVILIVEDELMIRLFSEQMFTDWGHTTLEAGDIDEALAHLHSPHHIDVLFTDIRLKAALQGGYEIAHRAIQLRPQLRVLYTSGNLISDKTGALFVKGAEYLQKPYTEAGLQKSIAGLLSAPGGQLAG